MNRFSSAAIEKLGYYVYLYTDPKDKKPFYVGSGTGNRAFTHLSDKVESEKVDRIAQIRKRGEEPIIEILAHGFADRETAFHVETAILELLGKTDLTNIVRGRHASKIGRIPAEEAEARYGNRPAKIEEPVLLIRINQLYEPGMPPQHLYEVTRGVWRIGQRRENANYAMAVYQGIVREVYRISRWHKSGATKYHYRDAEQFDDPDRWEFTGKVAEDAIRSKYLYKSVKAYFPDNSQSPYIYVNVQEA